MDELNLQEIEDKLNTEFASDQRLIFWYDTEGSFEDSVDSLNLQDATIWHLTENNAFRTKLEIEHNNTDGKYLIYAPFGRPEVSKNHLEDVLIYSKEFFADKLSLIAADIGLPDRMHKYLKSLGRFLAIGKKSTKASVKRTNTFMEFCKSIDPALLDENIVKLAAMCTVVGAKAVSVDDLMYAVFTYGNIEEAKATDELEEYELLEDFWNICLDKYGYSEADPSLMKLLSAMFVTYTCKDLGDAIPGKWQKYHLSKESNVFILMDNMKNNVLLQDNYDEIAKIISDSLDFEDILRNISLEKLLEISSSEAIDKHIIRWMIERIDKEDRKAEINGESIPNICEMRLKMHFGEKYQNEYNTLNYAYFILAALDYKPAESFENIVTQYKESDYKLDQAYRKFVVFYDKIEDKTDFEELRSRIENIYSNEYLEKAVFAWNEVYPKNINSRNMILQKDFYRSKVAAKKEKVAVIISDALRYEVGEELSQRFAADQNLAIEFDALLGTLPSFTPVGMAELLPHDNISMDDGYKVLVDGKACDSTEKREAILKDANPKSIATDYKSLNKLNTSDIKKISAGMEVIYIYHNKIDATGETAKTEDDTFERADKAVEEIYALVKTLSKSCNIYSFIITADHGFIYTRDNLKESDKLENKASKNAFLDRRFIIDYECIEADGVFHIELSRSLEFDDTRFIMLAKGMSVFKTGGGMNFVHGGSSAQELLIPCIEVKATKGIVGTSYVQVAVVTNVNKITNLSVGLDILQQEPVTDTEKAAAYNIRFEAEDGELISNNVRFEADITSEDPKDRMKRIKFSIKRKSYDNSKKYFLKIIDEKTGDEKWSKQVIMDLPFSDDFGF